MMTYCMAQPCLVIFLSRSVDYKIPGGMVEETDYGKLKNTHFM